MVEPSLSLPIIERCIMKGDEFGNWGQFLQAILVSFAWFFDAQQTFISAFTDAPPSWHCTSPSSSSSDCNSFNINLCNLPKGSWAWDLAAHTSVISEWSLQCDGSIITGLPASSFFMGCLTGGFLLSTIADSSLGRKNMLVLSCLLMSISGTITVFSTDIWMYSFLRFLTGCGRATIGTSSLVLSTELVTNQWQSQVGILGYFCFTMGFLTLPAIAFITRGSSWRLIYLWTCLPAVFYSFLVHFFVRESPRWICVIEQKEEVINLYSAIKMLMEKNWAFRRLVMVMCVGFGFGMVYYGMPLAVENLSFNNLYLRNTLNALSELPASLVTFFLIGKLSRKRSLLGFAMLSGICSIGCCIVEGDKYFKLLQMGLELISYFSACTAVDVLLIYALELFPTCVRNSAVAMVRQTLVLGGALSPMVVAIGRSNNIKWFTYGVFGLSIVTCGLFVVWLPETKGRTLCDTMVEEESNEVTFLFAN